MFGNATPVPTEDQLLHGVEDGGRDLEERGVNDRLALAIVLDAGAEDMDSEGEQFEVTCEPEDFETLLNALETAKIKWESAEISMIPETTIALEGDDAAKLMRLVDALEEQDDVQNVYGNFDVPDEDEDE